MESTLKHWLAGVWLALLAAASLAGTTTAFTVTAGSGAGSRDRQVKVYVPDGLSAAAPMVMALHGCQQTHDDVLSDWGLTAAADRYRFVLVAPFITSYDGLRNTNCWGFWLDQHRHQGRGEPEDLHRIALAVEARFKIDPARRYITGLSSGAAMSVVAAVTHNEYWAAAASASGLPYGEDSASVSFSGCPGSATFHAPSRVASDMRGELDNAYAIPLMVLQNDRDCTVLQAAGRNLRDAQLLVFGDAAHDTPAKARAQSSACTPAFGADYGCEQIRYTADGKTSSRSRVETVFYSGPIDTPNTQDTDHGHYWVGGEQGHDGKWSLRRGPSYPDIVWDFFARHPRDGGAAPTGQPQITLVGDNPIQLVRGQAFSDPGATASDPEDGALPVSADCSAVDVNRAGSYQCIYRATDRDGHVATATRRVVVVDPSVPPPSCANASAAPSQHIAAARAVFGGLFKLRALANGDRVDIGFAWDSWSRVTLYEGEPGRWFAARPAACGSP
jgi:poly(hydroxyalkanoate) depolymerase family esterase